MCPTPSYDLTSALATARQEVIGAGTWVRLLAASALDVQRLSPTELPQAACARLAELFDLDAAWLVAGGVAPQPRARWSRPGAGTARLGDQRLRVLVTDPGDGPTACRDGRYSVIVVPVGDGQTLVGAVRSAREFSDDDLACAQVLAATLGPAIGRPGERSAAARDRSDEHVLLLQSLSGALARARSEMDVAWAVVGELRALTDCHACRFYLLEPGGDRIVAVADSGSGVEHEKDRTDERACAIGEGIAGRMMVDPRPRLIPNVRDDEWAVDIPGADSLDESMLVAPIMVDGEPLGVLVLSKLGADRFDQDDLRLLEVVATTAGVACQTARLFAQVEQQAEVAEALLDLGAALSEQRMVDDVARLAAVAVDRLVECASLSVWLREGDRMRLAADVGLTPREIARLASEGLAASEPPFRDALDTRQVVVCEMAEAEPLARYLPAPEGSTFAVVAVGERAANRAAIVVQRGPRRGRPSSRDHQMLVGIADQVLMALTNRELYLELERSFLATVQALANALETKDEYTSDHAQALIGLTTHVATRLGVDGEMLRDVSFAAALHDIGKIGIPAEILNKPGELTAEEWDVMKQHPELGARIIEPVAALAGAREMVLACHEHWDGTGYPLGLVREEIPLGARIILACDAFHAMTSDRVYRSALWLGDAVAELRRCSGTLFDPDVCEVLIAAVTDVGSTRGG